MEKFVHEGQDTGLFPTYCPYGCCVLEDEVCPHGCRAMHKVKVSESENDHGA